MYNDLEIADYIIDFCNNTLHIGTLKSKYGYIMSNLYLQVLLYFLNHKYLKVNGKPLIKGHFDSWEFGPVLWDVYKTYKMYNGSRIRYILPTISDSIRMIGHEKPIQKAYDKNKISLSIRKFIRNNLEISKRGLSLLTYSPADLANVYFKK